MLAKVQKWGNSQGLRLTKALLEEACLNVGDKGRRQVKFVEKAPQLVVDDALAILDACLY